MDRHRQIYTFSSISRVSRETILILEEFEKLLINANKKLNLIGRSTIKEIWYRHILDSYQVIDFIDKNDVKLTDIGSGAGFPGIVLATVAKDRKLPIKIKLIEKSPKKSKFLATAIRKLKLDVEVSCVNIFENEKNIEGDVFVVRAFRPLSVILKLINNRTHNFKKFFIFLGKTGKEDLLEASKSWDIEYKQRVSITSSDSIIIEVNKLKKIN